MKTRAILSVAFLAATMACIAEEANPFVSQPPKEEPPMPSGESFVTVEEEILVKADQLDTWLEKNPLTNDATGLRNEVQIWIGEGKARLDHTAASTGTAGRNFKNSSGWEQTYATEFEPPEPGEWPVPTSFTTMTLGYTIEGNAGIEQGALVLRAKMDFCGMLPHHAWNELTEKTRQPDDVFIPQFCYIKVERVSENPANQDPFSERPKIQDASEYIRFNPGRTYLAGRADNDVPEPAESDRPDVNVKPPAKDPHRWVRLFFFRGAITETPAADIKRISPDHHVSAKLFRVNHKTLSDWLRKSDPARIPDIAWASTNDWKKNGEAEITCDLTSSSSAGSTNVIKEIVEVIYPTEWEPGDLTPGTGGKPPQREFSNAMAFETRHAGTTLQAEVISDPKGPLLRVGLERVVNGGKSVHHRILRDGEWKVDMTMPIFSSNSWQTDLRVKPGEWMFVGSGSDIDAKGKLDPNHAVLAFVKVE